MKRKRLLCLITVCVLCMSCSSMKDMWNWDKNVKKVELGMTKKEVTSILGQSYVPFSAVQTPEGMMEAIRYDVEANNDYLIFYVYSFRNGKLVEWHQDRERIRRQQNIHVETKKE